jgi:4a-hydroxytetrahydrobiopterin dehydratase
VIKEEVEKRLEQLLGWTLVDNTIEKNFKFADFRQAIEFINKVADIAEAENHHPDVLLWSWNNVKLTITTHAIKGLSERDFILASKIDKVIQKEPS